VKKSSSTFQLYEELVDVARKIFDEVRSSQGPFRSGACMFKGKKLFVINSRQPIDERIAALSLEIAQRGADQIYLKPIIRSEIERYRSNLNLPDYSRE